MKKFCCDHFKMYYELGDNNTPHIRILKLPPKLLNVGKTNFVYVISIGYTNEKKYLGPMKIYYCPFCGTILNKFYRSDEYINGGDFKNLIP